jgi:O-antigen ligase/tRNA A-37 threonylcarbamoyl transferase component Bud32
MQLSDFNNFSKRAFDTICCWILPIGYLLLLSAMFFLSGRSPYSKLIYGAISFPALFALILRPSELRALLREPLFVGFLLFSIWAIISLLWSSFENSASGQIKRPLHILMLFVGTGLIVQYRRESLHPILFCSAIIALFATLLSLSRFVNEFSPGMRMVSVGAFDNPLLSSHLFGFFCIYWLSVSMTCKRLPILYLSIPALAVMLAAVLATGSRTPLVALSCAVLWLCFICWNRRSALLVATIVVIAACVLLLYPQAITERGSSYRLEIWQIALGRIAEHPWIGHGYDAPLSINTSAGYPLMEPHSFALGTLYYVGIIGFVPWLLMQLWALLRSWRDRAQPLFIIASSWLVFGMGAGLTEGGEILDRPKEHWFLLWIPLALIAALNIGMRSQRLLRASATPLSASTFDTMTAQAQVIEADGRGPKVLQLADGSFLKLFRSRPWYTTGSFNPYSERFVINSNQLRSMDIPTPQILNLYALKDGSSAVKYQPISGQPLRQVLQSMSCAMERQALVERFGRFLGSLHEQGVYFRSLHLGNVLLMDNNEFGLIDVADMRILPSSLSLSLRQRNLRHMQRYTEDRFWLFEESPTALLQGYAVTSSITAVENMHKHIQTPGNNTVRSRQ